MFLGREIGLSGDGSCEDEFQGFESRLKLERGAPPAEEN